MNEKVNYAIKLAKLIKQEEESLKNKVGTLLTITEGMSVDELKAYTHLCLEGKLYNEKKLKSIIGD